MLKDLEVSFLTCNCVFYRPERKGRDSMDLEKQKWSIPRDSAQNAVDKNAVIWIVIMFTPRVMIMKMSNRAVFFGFSTDDSKKFII